jgi:outer membrane protein assembly factor BamB
MPPKKKDLLLKALLKPALYLACWHALSLLAGEWPQWRGPARDGHAPADETMPDKLSPPLPLAWRKDIGGGFSSPVVAQGKLLYLDAQQGQETAHLIEASSGKELWKVAYASVYEDEWGPGPRSTPILDNDRAYVQSCNGEFRCLSLTDGKVLWGTSFETNFHVPFLGSKAREGTASRRGNNGSGVISRSRIIVPVGSTNNASLVCFDKKTGAVLWASQSDEAAYSSPMVAAVAGVEQVVFFSAQSLMGVELTSGKLLWRVPLRTEALRHACTPIIHGDDVIVNSQTIGTVCFHIRQTGGKFVAEQKWQNKEQKINIATPVLLEKHLYTQGAGPYLICMDAGSGEVLWKQTGFGDKYTACIASGDKLLAQTSRGELVLIKASPSQYAELGRVQICGETWSHPALAEGKLFIREGLTRGWKLSCFLMTPQRVL